mmetsp:Transcript_7985/g.11790  ORF Transcript_7985/g.11790 Transcript_7985/m.11790 type:complete len:86 (+) Transcript_7985:328-585(+)
MHDPKENIEGLLRYRPDLRKVKSNGRSTLGVHMEGKTKQNLQQNLEILERFLPPDTMQEYALEGVDLLPYPTSEQENNLVIKFKS